MTDGEEKDQVCKFTSNNLYLKFLRIHFHYPPVSPKGQILIKSQERVCPLTLRRHWQKITGCLLTSHVSFDIFPLILYK